MLIHATLITFSNKGILFRGNSGCGKSDLALRLIEKYGATLVADDVVDVYCDNKKLYGKVCPNLEGLLEVRGIGIAKYNYTPHTTINLVVDLVNNDKEVERLPLPANVNIMGIDIPNIKLVGYQCSAEQKILLKLRDNLLKTD